MGNFALDDFVARELSESCYLEAGKGDFVEYQQTAFRFKEEQVSPMIIRAKSKSSGQRPLGMKTVFINCPLLPINNCNKRQEPCSRRSRNCIGSIV